MERTRLTVVWIVSSCVWALAAAQGALAQDDLNVEPRWVYLPTERDIASVYPNGADSRHTAGEATVKCTIGGTGDLKACAVTDEAPAGEGFGSAAMKLTHQYRMRQHANDGSPVAGRSVELTMDFTPRGWARLVDGSSADGPPQLVRLMSDPFNYAAPNYPEPARFRAVSARVVLHCSVKDAGGLDDCAVADESPAGLGFGSAALRSVRTLHVSRQTTDGTSTEGRVVEIPLVINPPCFVLTDIDRRLNGCGQISRMAPWR
jgi:TonB family protein